MTSSSGLWFLASPSFWAPLRSPHPVTGAHSGSCAWYIWSSHSLTWSHCYQRLELPTPCSSLCAWLCTVARTWAHLPTQPSPLHAWLILGRCGIQASSTSRVQPAGPSGQDELSGCEQYSGRRRHWPWRFLDGEATLQAPFFAEVVLSPLRQ